MSWNQCFKEEVEQLNLPESLLHPVICSISTFGGTEQINSSRKGERDAVGVAGGGENDKSIGTSLVPLSGGRGDLFDKL